MEIFNITKFNTDLITNELTTNNTFLLNKNNGGLNKVIYDLVTGQLSNKNISVNIDTSHITFCLCKEAFKMSTEQDKLTKKTPVLSIIMFLSDAHSPIVFTSIDIETYKYKEFTDTNDLTVLLPKKNSLVSFDPSKYYGSISLNGEHTDLYYLKINVWDSILSDSREYSGIENSNMDGVSILFEKSISSSVSETIVDSSIIEPLLYSSSIEDFNKLTKLINLIKTNINQHIVNVKITNVISDNINITMLENRYGNISKDLIPFLLKSEAVENDNRFFNNKIIQNALSKEICYWIIDECEKQKQWSASPYLNYNDYLSLETFPSVMSFILYIYKFWINNIRTLYDMNSIDLNIKDIFITRSSKDNNIDKNSMTADNSFLSFNIQLNSELDFNGGAIKLDDNNIELKQGDMIVYNGKKPRSPEQVSDGSKYMLVFFIDLIT